MEVTTRNLRRRRQPLTYSYFEAVKVETVPPEVTSLTRKAGNRLDREIHQHKQEFGCFPALAVIYWADDLTTIDHIEFTPRCEA